MGEIIILIFILGMNQIIRNFSIGWKSGSCGETYPGTGPASEPETQLN